MSNPTRAADRDPAELLNDTLRHLRWAARRATFAITPDTDHGRRVAALTVDIAAAARVCASLVDELEAVAR